MKKAVLLSCILLQTACATIVNDPMIPMTFTFSDGSAGECVFKNKRGSWPSDIPDTVMIRRSDDALIYDCESEDGRESDGSIVSQIEGAKLGASVIFFDFGITDAITDKHRVYQGNIVIPLAPKKQPVQASTQSTQKTLVSSEALSQDESEEERLRKIKQLYDDGLISEEVYLDKQRSILSN